MNKKLIDWIKAQRPGPFELNANQPTSNVFIADFIELNNAQFCRTVIELNDKIFSERTGDKANDNYQNDRDAYDLTTNLENSTSDNNCNESNDFNSDIQS